MYRTGVEKWEKAFIGLCLFAVLVPLAMLFVLLADVVMDGAGRLTWSFLTSLPSRKAELAGIKPALVGSIYLIGLTGAFAVPVGIGAAIYLEEYGGDNWLTRLIEVNIANLAGVPSIIYGLLGLEIFVRFANFGQSLMSGALTLALLILPIIIVASREALATVPNGLREGCYALGSTKWQAIRQVVVPMALPGMLTGSILAISRAIGETAPLIAIGALTYVTFLPDGPMSPFTALPIQIFNWVSRPQPEFVINAAAGIMVLMAILLMFNALAIYLRQKYQRRS
ncbi:MAG: phosphate ABC transporter permease PstA [Deltaproteobacteria bacterium]|nr:phosphate ABC transporter permease PstA [Deltaproteobacteria bacterium]